MSEITLDAYAKRICEVLAARPEPAVLVGHSMGGMAITQAAPRCSERIASMVYVAAFLPQDGDSLIALTQLPEGEGDQVQANLVVSGDPPVATMPAEASRAATYEHCSDEMAAWAIASRTPQPVFPFTEPVALDGFDFAGIPRAYVFCGQDRAIPPRAPAPHDRRGRLRPGLRAGHRPRAPALAHRRARRDHGAAGGVEFAAMPPTLPQVAGVEHREVSVRGLRIHVATAGPPDGPPVVLQHGWPQHWYEWRHLIGPLAEAGYRVIAPDFRGFGWSEYPPDEDFRKETLVDDLIALCDVLGHRRISLVGHDWGGWVGWLLCLRRPDLVDRAVLLSAPPPFPPDRIDPAALGRVGRLAYQIPIAAPVPHAAKLAWFQQMGKVLGGRPPDEVEVYAETLMQRSQVRASTLLYRQFLTRGAAGAARPSLRRAAPERSGAVPGRQRGPALLRGARGRADPTCGRRLPRRGAARHRPFHGRRGPRSAARAGAWLPRRTSRNGGRASITEV